MIGKLEECLERNANASTSDVIVFLDSIVPPIRPLSPDEEKARTKGLFNPFTPMHGL